jgi:outer membrane protein
MLKQLMVLLAAPVVVGAQQMTDTTFHPISATEAVRLAKENNVSNIQAANTVRTMNNNVRSAKAAMYPSLTATAGQSKSAGQRVGPGNQLIDFVPVWSYSTGLQSNVTLFDAGRMFADVKTAKANVSAAEATEVNTEYSIAFQVKQAYNAVLAARESEAAARAQLATAQQQLAVSIAKVNAGAANVSDSLRGIVTVGNAQLAVLQAQNTFRTQSATLTRLVGTPYFVTADPIDTASHTLVPVDSAAIMQLALRGPTIRQSEASMNAFSAAERSAKAAYLPTVTMNVSY